MMKHEFDALVGLTTDPVAYEKVEFVYMNSDKFNNKQELVNFYKEKDMNGIETIYKELLTAITRTEEFKLFISDLVFFAKNYVESIRKQLAEDAQNIFQDKTIVAMLHEYSVRSNKEQKDLENSFLHAVKYGHDGVTFSNNCLTNANSYGIVLADILIHK